MRNSREIDTHFEKKKEVLGDNLSCRRAANILDCCKYLFCKKSAIFPLLQITFQMSRAESSAQERLLSLRAFKNH